MKNKYLVSLISLGRVLVRLLFYPICQMLLTNSGNVISTLWKQLFRSEKVLQKMAPAFAIFRQFHCNTMGMIKQGVAYEVNLLEGANF